MALLPRLHLFEFNDQTWLPETMRRQTTGLLQTLLVLSIRYNRTIARTMTGLITRGLSGTSSDRIIDLCAGGGGPWIALQPLVEAETGSPVHIQLTDRFPNLVAFERAAAEHPERIGFNADSVDAMSVSDGLCGLRTVFDALHHFRPAEAQAIIADAVRSNNPIVIYEGPARHPLQLLYMLLAVPPTIWLMTPLIRPFEWVWIPLTYLLPVSVVTIVWDGLVSCMRVYTIPELQSLAREADPEERYTWDVGSILPGGIGGLYLVGTPLTTLT